jgi:endonuclease YncB( thermonuclease family)
VALELVTRCAAELRRVVDGDTYAVLVDLLGQGFDHGATTMRVRLRDYSCPETRRGTAADRARGRAAAAAAAELLSAGPLYVELKGQDSIGREVAWLWVDVAGALAAVGPELERLGHARPGAFMGG